MSNFEIIVSIGSVVFGTAAIVYAIYVGKTAGRDRPHDPERLRQFIAEAPYDDAETDVAEQLINQVEAWAGSRDKAIAWYETRPLPSFGNLTAAELVRLGRAEAVKTHIERIAVGGYT